MPKISFTNEQVSYMRMAKTIGHLGWKLNKLKPIKSKIKIQKRKDLEDTCCYCQRDTTNEYNMVLDIEHIIPKSARIRHMFTMKNLTVSCKRCNMSIKNTDTSFLSVPIEQLPRRAFKSKYYKFIHPNLDDIESHIERNVIQKGKIRIVKYFIQNNSEKGKFTYNYFKLMDFEIESANQSQGKKTRRINNERAAAAFAALVG